MDPREGIDLARTAAAGQSARERAYKNGLTWWQRRLLRWLFRDQDLVELVKARFEAHALRRWAWLWSDYIDRTETQERLAATRLLLEEDPRTERSVVHFLPADLETPTPVRPRRMP
jgi:hypothetical protein